MEGLLQEVMKKIDSLNSTLQELLKTTKTDNGSIISAILGIENKLSELRKTTTEKTQRNEDNIVFIDEEVSFNADIQSIHQRATKIRRSIISVWKKSLNERKQAYWNYLKCDNTANTYTEWSEKEDPVLLRKFRLRDIPGEHEDDRQIRRDTAISAFKAEIRIMKNRAERYNTTYRKVDSEMSEIFERRSGHNDEIRDKLITMWERECKDEEERSESIWIKKRDWLTSYESKFGSGIFLQEPHNQPVQSEPRRNTHNETTHRNGNGESSGVEHRRSENRGSRQSHTGNRHNYGSQQRYTGNRQNYGSHQSHTGNHRNYGSHQSPDRNPGHSRSNNQRQNNRNYRQGSYAHNTGPYNRQQTYPNSRPVQNNGTTYIGKNVRASFLNRAPYDKDGGSRHTEETQPKTLE